MNDLNSMLPLTKEVMYQTYILHLDLRSQLHLTLEQGFTGRFIMKENPPATNAPSAT